MSEYTVESILRKSIGMHPSLFSDVCDRDAAESRNHASNPTASPRGRKGALNRAKDLEFASRCAMTMGPDEAVKAIVSRGMAAWIAPLYHAARLLCLPQSIAQDAAIKKGNDTQPSPAGNTHGDSPC